MNGASPRQAVAVHGGPGGQSKIGRRIKLMLSRKSQNRPRITKKEAILFALLMVAGLLPLCAISCVTSLFDVE